MQLIFEQIRVGGDRNFGYLVADRDAGQGVLVDPSSAPELLTDRAEAQGVTVKQIINTHGHADHTNGNVRAVELTGAPVAAHPEAPETPDLTLEDGVQVSVGGVQLTVLHTPGHFPTTWCCTSRHTGSWSREIFSSSGRWAGHRPRRTPRSSGRA